MSKYHINPKTGNPGKCTAVKQCPFGGDSSHFKTKDEARTDFEESQRILAQKPANASELLGILDREAVRAFEVLETKRMTDGTASGSSVQSRAEDNWSKAQYLAAQYLGKKDSWTERRNYYHQMTDHIRVVNRELGEGSWGGPKPIHKNLVARLNKLNEDLRELSGPEGASKEKQLGLYLNGAK